MIRHHRHNLPMKNVCIISICLREIKQQLHTQKHLYDKINELLTII